MSAQKSAIFLGLFTLLVASRALAVPVVYEFAALSSIFGVTGSFTFTAPDFITSNVNVPAASLDVCIVTSPSGNVCGEMQFFADSSLLEGGSDNHDAIGFTATDGSIAATAFYYFANGAFGALGSYASVLLGPEQAGLLTVRAATAPEPAPIALLAIALAMAASCRRRRDAS
jgi:hypothetical protein